VNTREEDAVMIALWKKGGFFNRSNAIRLYRERMGGTMTLKEMAVDLTVAVHAADRKAIIERHAKELENFDTECEIELINLRNR
jgi:hypothetical protein